ncbi:Fluoroquinolones export permease protein [Caloramator mitchellensis]|uniref:Fluoroquinolones export permease protein n=1 Tax=Caloramator mitchellensis TaxID=908809 RepID=A0A0R3K4H5_CALMK|nr:hypothetical protein [Caloramator mitchellensis]KRQ87842.1 Fluoroquinolones export permease protein [Caloramator mitchellensis]
MRIINAIKNDIKFQFKYGFYYLYSLLSLLYILLIYFVPNDYKNIIAVVVLFSDPVALGMIFMGAIILFEKSENVLQALLITPLRAEEYIIAKVISISIISELSSLAIVTISFDLNNYNLFFIFSGVIFGSFISTLSGIIVASTVNSINQFIVRIIPLGIFLSIPPFAILLGINNSILNILPGNIVFNMLLSGMRAIKVNPHYIIIFALWLMLFFKWATLKINNMLINIGGVRNGD